MQNNGGNIYQNARRLAGLTQERAAELLNVSVRSLADYETGQRVPPNDVVDQMVMHYNSQALAVQHLRNSSDSARRLLPEVREIALPEAVLELINAVYDFADNKADRALIEIARDGVIDDDERPRYDHIMGKLQDIITAAMALGFAAKRKKED